MKKFIVPIIIVTILAGLVFGGYIIIDNLFPKATPIKVPLASAVVSMTVTKNEMRNAVESHEIANDNINSILSHLSKADATRKMSVQDSPGAKVYYEIAVKTDERTHYFYAYNEGEMYYVEILYEGIYTTDKRLIELLSN